MIMRCRRRSRTGTRVTGFALVSALLVVAAAVAAVPSLISYQGYLRNGTSHTPVTGSLRLSFSLYADSTGGTPLWSETQNAVAVNAGVFTVLLGSVTSLPRSVFTGAKLWLQTTVSDTTLVPRRPIVSVPYAFKAAKADTALWSPTARGDSLWNTDGANVWRPSGNVGIGTSSPGEALHIARGEHTVLYVTDSGSDFSDDTFNATIEASGGVHSQLHLKGRGGGGTAAGGLRAYFDGSVLQNPGWIGTSSNHNLGLGVNSTTMMLLSTTGGVGLGTLSPSGRLDVDGRTFCRDGIDFGQGTAPGGTDAGMISWGSTPTLKFTILAKEGKALSLGANNREDVVYITSGQTQVNGDLCVTGAKNAIVPTSQGMTKLYCDESTELRFGDSSQKRARLAHGHASVALDPLFLETVTISEEHPLEVWVTFHDPHSSYYVKTSTRGFEVIDDCNCDASFSWKVEAKRKGYENTRLETTPLSVAAERR